MSYNVKLGTQTPRLINLLYNCTFTDNESVSEIAYQRGYCDSNIVQPPTLQCEMNTISDDCISLQYLTRLPFTLDYKV